MDENVIEVVRKYEELCAMPSMSIKNSDNY